MQLGVPCSARGWSAGPVVERQPRDRASLGTATTGLASARPADLWDDGVGHRRLDCVLNSERDHRPLRLGGGQRPGGRHRLVGAETQVNEGDTFPGLELFTRNGPTVGTVP